MRFNPAKYHSILTPLHEGAAYYQDGFYFSPQGELVEHLVTEEQRAALAKSAEKKAESKKAAKTEDKQEKEEKPSNPAETKSEDKADEGQFVIEVDGEKLDLEDWATGGQTTIPMIKLAGAIKKAFPHWGSVATREQVAEMIETDRAKKA